MVAALRLVITAVRFTGTRRYPPSQQCERPNRGVTGHFCHTFTRLVLQHPTKDTRSKLRLRLLPNLCGCCFNDHVPACIFSTSARPECGLTLGRSRRGAASWPGASAPRFSATLRVALPGREGTARLSQRTLGARNRRSSNNSG